jgi:hypothetical protein
MPSLVLTVLLAIPQIQAEPVCAGMCPRVSPDGRWVALQRAAMSDQPGLRGLPEFTFETWVRDLRSGEEKRLAKDAWASGWIDPTTVVFHDGTSAGVNGAPDAGKIAKPPAGISIRNCAWAPGGRKLAYSPICNWSGKPPLPWADRKIYIVEGSAHPASIELGHELMAENEGLLSWSPDCKRLAFHQVFFRYGNMPVRRIGVIDVAAGTHRFVGEGAYLHGNPGLSMSDRRGDGSGTWSAKGDRFVFVTGRGGGEADVYVSNADGTEVKQLTEDADCKWAPVLDPAGRRVAFCAARLQEGNLVDGRIRILDLYTGRETSARADPEGTGSRIQWLTDGSGIIFAWESMPGDFRGSEKVSNLFKAVLPKPDALAPGAAIVSKPPLTRKERILKALISTTEEVVEWAAEEAQALADPAIIPDLRKALGRATQGEKTQAERALLFAVSALNARDAAPEVIGAIHSKYDANQHLALGIVGQWRLKQATDTLLKILEKTPEDETNVHAAAALAWHSHETGWKLLERYLTSGEKEIRGAVAHSLDGLADPKAVPILIRLVDDSAVLYISQGEVTVGDHAERALARITGVTFNRKPIAWLSWWNEQAGKLPAVPSPNPGLQKLDEEMKRRGEEWQEKMKR